MRTGLNKKTRKILEKSLKIKSDTVLGSILEITNSDFILTRFPGVLNTRIILAGPTTEAVISNFFLGCTDQIWIGVSLRPTKDSEFRIYISKSALIKNRIHDLHKLLIHEIKHVSDRKNNLEFRHDLPAGKRPQEIRAKRMESNYLINLSLDLLRNNKIKQRKTRCGSVFNSTGIIKNRAITLPINFGTKFVV